MTSRLVRVGRMMQVVTTAWVPGRHPDFTARHEHVVLATPAAHSDTQRMRLLTAKEMGRDPYQK